MDYCRICLSFRHPKELGLSNIVAVDLESLAASAQTGSCQSCRLLFEASEWISSHSGKVKYIGLGGFSNEPGLHMSVVAQNESGSLWYTIVSLPGNSNSYMALYRNASCDLVTK